MKTRIYWDAELAQRVHWRLLAKYGLRASRLYTGRDDGAIELEVAVEVIRRQLGRN